MKRKKLAVILFTMLFILSTNIFSVSANNISVCLDGTYLSFDVQPQIINGRTLVPMRKIFESLGAVVSWDGASRTATGRKGDAIVNVSIDSKTLFKNGVPKTLDVAPTLVDGRTLVPVRAIAESFDCTVEWIGDTRTVKITTNENFSSEKTKLTASEISEKVSSSVFYIEVYDEKSQVLGSGSGFFISSDGVAVTNYHVIEGTSKAQITTINGNEFNVNSIIAFDENLDVALIRVDKTSLNGKTVSGFSSATMADSNNIKAGQTVYAIGSPVGLQNTISNGIISNTNQIVGEDAFIQITAPISHGSSGGALVDEFGEVLGITSAGIDEAQNIGFAIPINIIKSFDTNLEGMTYENFALSNNEFTLILETDNVDIEIGKSHEILIYAEGKTTDWSIYWDTEQDYLVDCEWGDWLENNSSIIPLTITGLNEGVARITIYSDVDFKGKDILVSITKPAIEFYPSSYITLPTYTSITGEKLIDYEEYEIHDLYVYNYYDVDTVQSYVDFLLDCGFTFEKETKEKDFIQYFYLSPDGRGFSLALAHRWNQVWIFVPRY